MPEAGLQVIVGGAVSQGLLMTDPWRFRAACVDAFVASWRARGFSPVAFNNDVGQLERTLKTQHSSRPPINGRSPALWPS